MTVQQILETVPHNLLEKLADFCDDNEKRQCIVHKTDQGFKLEYKIIELVSRT